MNYSWRLDQPDYVRSNRTYDAETRFNHAPAIEIRETSLSVTDDKKEIVGEKLNLVVFDRRNEAARRVDHTIESARAHDRASLPEKIDEVVDRGNDDGIVTIDSAAKPTRERAGG